MENLYILGKVNIDLVNRFIYLTMARSFERVTRATRTFVKAEPAVKCKQ